MTGQRVDSRGSSADTAAPHDNGRRAAWASFIGAVGDWYDYFLYGTAAGLVLGGLFFPGNAVGGTLAAFATFAVGFFFRPVGSIFFGHFGDKLGRKRMLIWTMILMGGASTLVGLLPTYAAIGIAAPILLVTLRAIQGFAVGGEYGGAALMAVESAPVGKRAARGSVVQIGAFIGLMLATGIFLGIKSAMSPEDFLAWGWRIPFLLSAVIVVVGYFVRRSVNDTPVFTKLKADGKIQKTPLLVALKTRPMSFLIIIGLYLAASVGTYMATTFSLSYGKLFAGVDSNLLLLIAIITAAVASVTVWLAARLGDRIGYFKVFVFGAALVAVMAFPFFLSLNTGQPWLMLVATLVLVAVGTVCMTSVQQPIFTQLFDAGFRYSGAGFGYGLGAAISGITPFIALSLAQVGAQPATGPAIYLAGIALITLITAVLVRKRIGSIHRSDTLGQ